MTDGRGAATSRPSVTVYVTGAARGNPGLAGAGIVIVDAADVVRERAAKYLGSATALQAQLQALALALRYARPFAPAPLALVLGNDTVVRQLAGEHPARHPAVLRMLADLDALMVPFGGVTYRLGRGDERAEAERLANLAIDTRLHPLPAYDRPLPR
jgi:ribonuclease HI